MMTHLKYWLKGLAVAATSMIVYAVALGCYIALMLLVISMEEGGDNLSALSVPLTEAVVLLSQGIGFRRCDYADNTSSAADSAVDCADRLFRYTIRYRYQRVCFRIGVLGADERLLRP